MPKRLHLEEHLSSQEPECRYRKAKDPVERTHLLIVRQLPLGKTPREVSEARATLRSGSEISLRHNEEGVEGLGDRGAKTLAPKIERCSLWSTNKRSKKR
jgi:hypothetical protein